jgi:dienelactone hydrolase
MHILVCSDIFGSTSHLKKLLDEGTHSADTVSVVDPYNGAPQRFNSERQAYDCFTQAGGINGYIDKVAFAIGQQTDSFIVLGFSAGGAAAWKALSTTGNPSCMELNAFYPGQIRHYVEVQPLHKSRLIFAVEEDHFNVQSVHAVLSKYALVSSHISSYKHGFMNRLSPGFSQQAYDIYVKKLKHWFGSAAN